MTAKTNRLWDSRRCFSYDPRRQIERKGSVVAVADQNYQTLNRNEDGENKKRAAIERNAAAVSTSRGERVLQARPEASGHRRTHCRQFSHLLTPCFSRPHSPFPPRSLVQPPPHPQGNFSFSFLSSQKPQMVEMLSLCNKP